MDNTEKHTIEVYCENGGWIEVCIKYNFFYHRIHNTHFNRLEKKQKEKEGKREKKQQEVKQRNIH